MLRHLHHSEKGIFLLPKQLLVPVKYPLTLAQLTSPPPRDTHKKQRSSLDQYLLYLIGIFLVFRDVYLIASSLESFEVLVFHDVVALLPFLSQNYPLLQKLLVIDQQQSFYFPLLVFLIVYSLLISLLLLPLLPFPFLTLHNNSLIGVLSLHLILHSLIDPLSIHPLVHMSRYSSFASIVLS